jgi:hypothetical protein
MALQHRLLMCCVALAVASLMIGASTIALVATGELGSCAAYSGLPAEGGDTAGMVFIRGESFVTGSERHRPEERFTHIVRVKALQISAKGDWLPRFGQSSP